MTSAVIGQGLPQRAAAGREHRPAGTGPAGPAVRGDRRPDPAALPAGHRGAGVHHQAGDRSAEPTAPEHQRICDLCRRVRSVAEIAALLRMPLGVARVLVADMAGGAGARAPGAGLDRPT